MTFPDREDPAAREPEATQEGRPEPIGDPRPTAFPFKEPTRAETEAFNARLRDQVRQEREAAKDAARQRYMERPFPGGPLTAGLTSREAAELSSKLADGWQELWDTKPDIDEWQTPEADAHAEKMWELEDLLDRVEDETIVSGLRDPLESIDEFRQRAEREPDQAADAAAFSGLREPQPEAGFEMGM